MAGDLALLFPGQGAHDLRMLDGVRRLPGFAERHAIVAELLGRSPLEALAREDVAFLNANRATALLTVLVSSLALDAFVAARGERPDFVAGYSVGTWTALHAAGSLPFERLAEVVAARAAAMDACFRDRAGAMLAVFGLLDADVEGVCASLRAEGHAVWIGNHNCAGQATLSGAAASIAAAESAFAALRPRKLVRVPVSGGWHSPLLALARDAFLEVLARTELAAPRVPVVDNVTGGFLPTTRPALDVALADHLDHPVRWEAGVRTLIAAGARRFVEIGYGNVLTKFGLFIDRTAQHEAFGG
ncbi:MAG TPA: acyltransferase domain-containing protein [Minicystis sp.]|nr:acyltransferase domain-containing protein [Minicystis sp.]